MTRTVNEKSGAQMNEIEKMGEATKLHPPKADTAHGISQHYLAQSNSIGGVNV
jgi:hypothetical protein